MKSILGGLAAVLLLFAIFLPATVLATSGGHGSPHKTSICHRTASDTNPYVYETVDNASLPAHFNNLPGHPARYWKSDGVFRGVSHVKGDAKNDYIATKESDCRNFTNPSPEPSSSPSASVTPTPEPSLTPEPSQTVEPSSTPTFTPTPTPSESSTPTPTPSVDPRSTPTPSPSPTVETTQPSMSPPAPTAPATDTEDPSSTSTPGNGLPLILILLLAPAAFTFGYMLTGRRLR